MKVKQYYFRIYYLNMFGKLEVYYSFNYPNSSQRNKALKRVLDSLNVHVWEIQDVVKFSVEVEL